MKMSNKMYDIMKYIAQIFIPALTVFVGVVMKCLNLENVDVVITIMTAFDTFLGAILQISTSNYKKEE